MSETPAPKPSDERVKSRPRFREPLIGPELGGICGTVLVFAFFLLTAHDSGMFNAAGVLNWSYV